MSLVPISEYGVESAPGALTHRLSAILANRPHSKMEHSVDSLVATTDEVSPELVETYEATREWERDPIEAAVVAGRTLVLDGNHRLAAAAAAGEETVPVLEVRRPVEL